jgi:hypothetical protein
MKYIDSEKLIAEIKRRLSEIPTPKVGDSDSIENFYRRNELMRIKKFVSTLQQEQPDMDLDKLVNEEFASHSRTTEYGLVATYNRDELSRFIKRMAIVFNARNKD